MRIRKHFEVGMGDGKRVGVPFFLVVSKKHLCVFLGLGFSSNYLSERQELLRAQRFWLLFVFGTGNLGYFNIVVR